MIKITMPDFEQWAEKLVESGTIVDVYTGTIMLNSFPDRLEQALKEAFEQGRSLGRREAETNWWEHQDKSLQEPK